MQIDIYQAHKKTFLPTKKNEASNIEHVAFLCHCAFGIFVFPCPLKI